MNIHEISIDECRIALGKEAEGLTDVEIAEIRYSLAKKLEDAGLDFENRTQ